MTSLPAWASRPLEEANLFNPAFCSALSFEFVRTYTKERPDGAPLPLLPLVFSIVLHSATRKKLPGTTLTALYEWIQRNNHCLIGLPDRTTSVVPLVKEAIIFSLSNDILKFNNGYYIVLSEKKASFTPKFLEQSTNELNDIVDRTRFLARWFVKSGSESSILSSWGIRP